MIRQTTKQLACFWRPMRAQAIKDRRLTTSRAPGGDGGSLSGKKTCRWTSSRSSSTGDSRMEKMLRTIQTRYPDISAHHIPSLTAAFVLLHELTALVPLLAIFGLVQASGTGAKLVHFIRRSLPPPSPSQESSSSSQEPSSSSSSSSSQDSSQDHSDIHASIAGSLNQALDESASKVSKIAQKYGYNASARDPEDELEPGTSMLDNGVLASGLVAYLSVKILLPLRVSVSVYLTPSVARQIRRMAHWEPKKPGE